MTEGWLRHQVGAFTLDVRWSAASGEVLVLFGPSGAGKTTTLRAIAGLLRPRAGRIVIGGAVVFDSVAGLWVAPHCRRVGYLPQQYALFPHLRVRENVAFGLRPSGGWTPEARQRRVSELLALLHIGELDQRYPGQLSGGQQQRVALARALAPGPRLLLLDEPFSALDQELRGGLRRELRALSDRTGIPVVLVTHDPATALGLGDRVLALDQGQVVAEGSPLQVLQRPASERLSRLIQVENVFQASVVAASREDGVMTCDLGGLMLAVPFAPVEPGRQVRIGLRAGDILVATQPPQGLSAQNTLKGTVVAVEPKEFEAEVTVDCGQAFRAEVTPRAVARLGLQPGKAVWLVIKSNSCFLIE